MTSRPFLVKLARFAALAGLCLAGPRPSVAAPSPSWLDARAAQRTFADVSRLPATTLPGQAQGPLALPVPFRFRGALYDTAEMAAPGSVRLTWTDGGRREDPGGLLIQPSGSQARWLPGGTVQLRQSGNLMALRMVGLADGRGEGIAHDILLETGEPNGNLVLQWLLVPTSLRHEPSAVIVADLVKPAAASAPVSDGLALRPGTVVVFPGDLPWNPDDRLLIGCGIAPNWCDVVRAYDPGCITPTGHNDETACSVTDAKRWHFNEGQYCRSCPYTFYVTVECGTEMHLPFRDMEGNQIQITDVFTGVVLGLEALNDCAKSAFQYCNGCAVGSGGLTPDPNGTICPPGSPTPRLDCIPYLQRSTLIQWGWPLTDRDGDTVADDLPCGPPNTDGCNGRRSGAYAGHEEQNTDVVLHGDPALCGVFRIDIVAGGFHWFLSANCTGIVPDDPIEIERNFRVYQNCSDALAAFDPVPELAITRLDFIGVCPDIEVEVEITNLGCVDAPSSPVHLDFSRASQRDIDLDLGVIAAGTSVTMRVPVSLVSTPQSVTATVDPLNVIAECTEQAAGSFSGCAPVTGAVALTRTLCSCLNTVVPAVATSRLVACNGQSVSLDASGSSAVPCTGGTVEYRVLTQGGALVRDWGPDPVTSFTPARCPSLDSYILQVRCSLETGPDCQRDVLFVVECTQAPSLSLAISDDTVCQGDPVTITATPGFGTYVWDDGRAGRTFVDRPGATTTYRVTATTPSGCIAQGDVTVTVVPDPLPGPLGASVRVQKSGADTLISYAELPLVVGTYGLIIHEGDGTTAPCASSEPVTKPSPLALEAAPLAMQVSPGVPPPQFTHADGVNTCPRLLFYKVVATSACRGTRGTACNGWPMQRIPCP